MFDWNDLRYLLAVAHSGSTLSAARHLRVSQTTVARRIAALEEALGTILFERRAAGYALTPMGDALLGQAQSVERAATGFAEAAAALARDVSGTVRLTTEEIFANTLLGPILRDLHDVHPDIVIELDTAHALRDLGAGEADIALRSTASAQPAGTVGRRLCSDDWTLYCRVARRSQECRGAEGPHARWRRRRQGVARVRSMDSRTWARGAGRDPPRHRYRPAVRGALGVRHCRASMPDRRRQCRGGSEVASGPSCYTRPTKPCPGCG